MLSGLPCKSRVKFPLCHGIKTHSCMHAAAFLVTIWENPGTMSLQNMSLKNSSSPWYILKSSDTITRPLWTQQLSCAFCRLPHSLFSTSQFSPSLSAPFFSLFSLLTGCHHIFSQLPTTSYSATTDLNTDLASSVPLRRERERYRTLSLPPRCCRVEFCLSHQSSGCWSTPCYFYTFCLSADQSPDRKTLLSAQQDNSHRQVQFTLYDGGHYIRPGGCWLSTVIVPGEGFFFLVLWPWFSYFLFQHHCKFQREADKLWFYSSEGCLAV